MTGPRSNATGSGGGLLRFAGGRPSKAATAANADVNADHREDQDPKQQHQQQDAASWAGFEDDAMSATDDAMLGDGLSSVGGFTSDMTMMNMDGDDFQAAEGGQNEGSMSVFGDDAGGFLDDASAGAASSRRDSFGFLDDEEEEEGRKKRQQIPPAAAAEATATTNKPSGTTSKGAGLLAGRKRAQAAATSGAADANSARLPASIDVPKEPETRFATSQQQPSNKVAAKPAGQGLLAGRKRPTDAAQEQPKQPPAPQEQQGQGDNAKGLHPAHTGTSHRPPAAAPAAVARVSTAAGVAQKAWTSVVAGQPERIIPTGPARASVPANKATPHKTPSNTQRAMNEGKKDSTADRFQRMLADSKPAAINKRGPKKPPQQAALRSPVPRRAEGEESAPNRTPDLRRGQGGEKPHRRPVHTITPSPKAAASAGVFDAQSNPSMDASRSHNISGITRATSAIVPDSSPTGGQHGQPNANNRSDADSAFTNADLLGPDSGRHQDQQEGQEGEDADAQRAHNNNSSNNNDEAPASASFEHMHESFVADLRDTNDAQMQIQHDILDLDEMFEEGYAAMVRGHLELLDLVRSVCAIRLAAESQAAALDGEDDDEMAA